MSTTDRKPAPSPSSFAWPIVGSLAVAGIVTVIFVLPAEYGVDPTGLGGALGLTQLSGPQEIVVETRFTAPPEIASLRETPFRSDTIAIEVSPFNVNFGQLEYKVSMNEGDLLVYSWSSDKPLIFEFHGHTVDDGSGEPIEVMDYIAGDSDAANGTLVAPIDGIHGWYFANSAFGEPARVELRLAGYYTLEPGVMELGR